MRATLPRRLLALLLGLLLLVPTLAAAQSEEPGMLFKKITRITFGQGDVIEVGIDRPDGDLYTGRLVGPRKSLVRVRENWDRAVLDSAGRI